MILEPAPVYAGTDTTGGSVESDQHAPFEAQVPRNFENITAREIMNGDVPHIPSLFSLHNALMTLDRYEYSALPVIDDKGRYRGLLSRADVLAALGKNIRPPLVGGMATPLGVWLTNGSVNGGAPSIGLFLSGLTLAGCLATAQLLIIALMYSLNPAWAALAVSGRIGSTLDGTGLLNTLAFLAHGLFFLTALRVIPMAGIHAAEHQTVHAMERGLPLELEYVSQMPRAHPRCGTNLLALVGLVTIGFAHLPSLGPDWVLIALVITFFSWRSLGSFIQTAFTTRPASKKQLESGIKAGRELMENYQAQPFAAPSSPFKLLNNGLIYSALGMICGTSAFMTLLNYLANRLVG
ncbi:DUF1385 domain-containing protein [bacterium]|nr:MAG: DUF1385 domain-containing protein [bacterium]